MSFFCMSAANAKRQLAPTLAIGVRVHTARRRRQLAFTGVLPSEGGVEAPDRADVCFLRLGGCVWCQDCAQLLASAES